LTSKDGKVVLVVGSRNAYGPGIYFAGEYETGRGQAGQATEYVISRSQAEAAGAVWDDKGFPKTRNALTLQIIEFGKFGDRVAAFCLVMEAHDQTTSGMAHNHVFSDGKQLSSKALKAYKDMAKPSKCLGFRYRILGLVLSLVCHTIAKLKHSQKWYCLGRFLLGRGGQYIIPSHVAKAWNTGTVKDLDNGRMFIRPDANTQLFWIVGGMTVERTKTTGIYGEDTYDFHPQVGQNTIKGGMLTCWAFSGGPEDPTRIPVTLGKYDIMPVVRALFPKLTYRYIREDNGFLLFSNDLWNALGGKPFTSMLKIHK
jgi:hypothetical protein